jgi:hypothetical protein
VSEQFIQPLVEAAKPTTGQRIGSGISDAIQGFLATKFGRPQGPSAIEGVRARNQAEADRINQQNLLKAQVELGERARVQTAEEKEADREDRQKEARKRDFRELMATAGREERDRAFRTEMASRREEFELSLAKIRAAGGDPSIAREQRKSLLGAQQQIVALKNNIPELLKTMTPEQIRESAMDDLDASGLDAEGRALAEMFFEAKIGPLLVPPPAPEVTPGDTLDRSGAVISRNAVGQPFFGPFEQTATLAKGAITINQILKDLELGLFGDDVDPGSVRPTPDVTGRLSGR